MSQSLTLVTSSPTMKPARYASESDITADTQFISSTSTPHGSSASRASRSVTTWVGLGSGQVRARFGPGSGSQARVRGG